MGNLQGGSGRLPEWRRRYIYLTRLSSRVSHLWRSDMSTPDTPRRAPRITGFVVAILGLALALGGVWLVTHNNNTYYLGAGAGGGAAGGRRARGAAAARGRGAGGGRGAV